MSPVPPTPETDHSADPAALASALESLGAETRTMRRVKRVVPWVISIGVHVALLVVGIFIPWSVKMLLEEEETPAVIIADFENLTPLEMAVETSTDVIETQTQFEDRSETVLEHLEVEDTPQPIEPLTDAAPAPAFDPDTALAPFTPRAEDLAVSFGGLHGSNARHIVYVVDASGSMLTYLPVLVDELSRSIDRLQAVQSFRVILFQANEAIVVPGPDDPEDANRRRGGGLELLSATERNKLFVLDWMDLDSGNIRARGKSNPLAAIRLALDGVTPKPDVVFMLSTDITGVGEYEIDQQELLQMIARLNRDRRGNPKSLIKTIQFIYEDPLETLRLIAEAHGGPDGYRFLSREQLGLN